MAVAQAGGLNLKLTIVDLPAMKAELPFGQVVLLRESDYPFWA